MIIGWWSIIFVVFVGLWMSFSLISAVCFLGGVGLGYISILMIYTERFINPPPRVKEEKPL